VLDHLSELTPVALERLDRHERAHQNRPQVLDGIRTLLHEPWPGYDGLDVNAVRAGLDGADDAKRRGVLAYERAHRNRAEIVLAAQQHT
jgi:hypothetical protein